MTLNLEVFNPVPAFCSGIRSIYFPSLCFWKSREVFDTHLSWINQPRIMLTPWKVLDIPSVWCHPHGFCCDIWHPSEEDMGSSYAGAMGYCSELYFGLLILCLKPLAPD